MYLFALSDTAIVQLCGVALAFITAVGSFATAWMQLQTKKGVKEGNEKMDETREKVNQVSDHLSDASEKSVKRDEEVKEMLGQNQATTDSVHAIVNGGKGIFLTDIATLSRRLATVTPTPDNILAADLAEKVAREHIESLAKKTQ